VSSRFNRKVNATLQRARMATLVEFVLGALGGTTLTDYDILVLRGNDFADMIQQQDWPLNDGAGGTGSAINYAFQLVDHVFPGYATATTLYESSLLEYLDGDYAPFNGGSAAAEGSVEAFRDLLDLSSDYNTDITGLGAQLDPLAKLMRYTVNNATFP